MKKLLLSAAALYLFSSASANAQVSMQLNVGEPAYVVAPSPVYVSPYPSYYDPQHRRHNFEYWQQRRAHDHHEEQSRGEYEGHGEQDRGEHEGHGEQGRGEHGHR